MPVGDHYADAFATAIGAGQLPRLPTLPSQKNRRPTIAPAPTYPNRLPTIDEAMPAQKLDKPQLEEISPRSGDEGLVMSPEDQDNPIPSSPTQGTPGDAARDWPQPASQRRSAPSQAPAEVRAAIEQAAKEAGQDPAYALAVASRESSFNPNAGGTGSIRGLFQMTGANRARYGVPDDADTLEQARGFFRFTGDLRNEMAARLGRQPTDTETYLGHYFGGGRAARMISGMRPDTHVSEVFTPNELAGNPNFERAGTVGGLTSGVQADMARRMQTYGAPADRQGDVTAQYAGEQQPDYYSRNKAYARPGNYNTDLGNQEQRFRQWVVANKVPFDPDAKEPQDYDMRGFYKALQAGDQRAKSAVDPNDQQMHYPDYWKTPYHRRFSSESQWAAPGAPSWNDKDQIVTPSGDVTFDDRNRAAAPLGASAGPSTSSGADFSDFGAQP